MRASCDIVQSGQQTADELSDGPLQHENCNGYTDQGARGSYIQNQTAMLHEAIPVEPGQAH